MKIKKEASPKICERRTFLCNVLRLIYTFNTLWVAPASPKFKFKTLRNIRCHCLEFSETIQSNVILFILLEFTAGCKNKSLVKELKLSKVILITTKLFDKRFFCNLNKWLEKPSSKAFFELQSEIHSVLHFNLPSWYLLKANNGFIAQSYQ